MVKAKWMWKMAKKTRGKYVYSIGVHLVALISLITDFQPVSQTFIYVCMYDVQHHDRPSLSIVMC
jgi:hypothetical protein